MKTARRNFGSNSDAGKTYLVEEFHLFYLKTFQRKGCPMSKRMVFILAVMFALSFAGAPAWSMGGGCGGGVGPGAGPGPGAGMAPGPGSSIGPGPGAGMGPGPAADMGPSDGDGFGIGHGTGNIGDGTGLGHGTGINPGESLGHQGPGPENGVALGMTVDH